MLMGIFTFPIFVQPLHVLKHHAPGHHCECPAHPTQHTYVQKDKNPHIENAEQKKSSCAICNYEFSSNDIPDSYCNGRNIPEAIYAYNKVLVAQKSSQNFTHTTPRAPPRALS